MQNTAVHRASDLPREVKAAVEQLLGRPIGADEEISIAAVPPQKISPSEPRATIAQRLEAFLDRRDQKVRNIPDEEIDTAIDAAVNFVRHHRG